MKRIYGIALIIGLMVMATVAFAQNQGGHGGCPGGGGPGYVQQQLTPEQQQKFEAIQDDFIKNTEELREDLWAKQTELNALAGNTQAEPEYITKLVSEIKEMRSKLFKQHDAFMEKVEKEVGITFGKRGHGRHGFGRGSGPCGAGPKPGCPYTN